MTLATSLRRGHDTTRFTPVPRLELASRIRSSIRSAHLLSRPAIPAGQKLQPPVGFHYGVVASTREPLFEALVTLARENRLDRSWCVEQFAKGSIACVALLARTTQAVGMGWVTPRASYVNEIQCTFDPLPGGCYLYCGYVSPLFRGRRIHRLLDAARLVHAAEAFDASIGYTLVVPTNLSSLRGHASAGFTLAARISILDTGPLVLALLRRTRWRAPIGSFHCENAVLRSGLNVLRACAHSQNAERASAQDRRPPLI